MTKLAGEIEAVLLREDGRVALTAQYKSVSIQLPKLRVSRLTERERMLDRAVLLWIERTKVPYYAKVFMRSGRWGIGHGAYPGIRAIFAELCGK